MTTENRKAIRYYPDDGTFAQIDTNGSEDKFNPEIVCLVLEQSETGCGLVILEKEYLTLKENFIIQVGNSPPTTACCRWNESIDEKLRKIGVEFQKK